MKGPEVSYPSGSTKRPRFPSTPRSSCRQLTPSSTLDSYNTPSRKDQKMSQLFSHNYGSNNNYGSFNTTYINSSVADHRSNILAWISPLDPKLRHRDIRDRRVKNVGGWLLETKEFRSWCASGGRGESDNAVLFCYGGPGVGKTYLR